MLVYVLLVAVINLAIGFAVGRYVMTSFACPSEEREIVDGAASRPL